MFIGGLKCSSGELTSWGMATRTDRANSTTAATTPKQRSAWKGHAWCANSIAHSPTLGRRVPTLKKFASLLPSALSRPRLCDKEALNFEGKPSDTVRGAEHQPAGEQNGAERPKQGPRCHHGVAGAAKEPSVIVVSAPDARRFDLLRWGGPDNPLTPCFGQRTSAATAHRRD